MEQRDTIMHLLDMADTIAKSLRPDYGFRDFTVRRVGKEARIGMLGEGFSRKTNDDRFTIYLYSHDEGSAFTARLHRFLQPSAYEHLEYFDASPTLETHIINYIKAWH